MNQDFGLSLRLERPEGRMLHKLEQDRMGKTYEIVDYWLTHPKQTISIHLRGENQNIPYILAPQSFLNYMATDELFGVYAGEMMFISSKLAREHPAWVPLVVLKLRLEKIATPGDPSGRTKHLEAAFATTRIAGRVLDETEYRSFLDTYRRHESAGYFDLDRELTDFLASGDGDSLKAKRKYLEAHHHNKWVAHYLAIKFN